MSRRDTRDLERSNLREAAVDEDFGSIDEATVVRSEENDGFCHLIRSAQPSERNIGDHARLELPGLFLGRSQAVQSWRCDRSRADRVYANVAIGQIEYPATREFRTAAFVAL